MQILPGGASRPQTRAVTTRNPLRTRTGAAAPSALQASAWRRLAWLCVLLIAALLARAWSGQQWKMTAALAIFLLASLGILRLRRLPAVFQFLLVFAALVNGAGGAFDWFEAISWYDEFAHLYTGFAGLAAIGYLYARDLQVARGHLVAWCIGMALVLGGGWECLEALGGELDFGDTLSDLVLNTIGAALGALFAGHARVASSDRGRAFSRPPGT